MIERIGLPVVIRPAFILGGKGTGIATTPDEFERMAAVRPRRQPGERDPHRAVDRRVEGVRARGHARSRGQLRDHLLDREPRPDGRAHRRLDHRRPGPDAQRRRVPADARRRLRVHPPRRRGDRRVERAVRPRPHQRRHGHHRDEPARVAVVGAGVARPPGSRSPRSPPSSRSATRSTRSPTTSPRPRRPASSRPSTTSSPRCRAGPSRSSPARPGVLGTSMQSVGEAMAIGRTFPESLQKAMRSLEHGRLGLACDPGRGGARRPRRRGAPHAGPPSARPTGPSSSRRRCAAASPSTCWPSAPRSTRGSSTRSSPSSRSGPRLAEVGFARHGPRASWRRAKRLGFSDAQLGWLWSVPEADVRAARLAAGVRVTFKTVDTCAAEFEAATPYHYSTYEDEDEVAPVRQGEGAHPRLRPEPDRAGHRVRLLLRARQLRPRRRRLRDGDAQLQPRDGVHRLRHLRPPLLRAAHPRGRPQRDRGRAGRRHPQGRHRRASAARRR